MVYRYRLFLMNFYPALASIYPKVHVWASRSFLFHLVADTAVAQTATGLTRLAKLETGTLAR